MEIFLPTYLLFIFILLFYLRFIFRKSNRKPNPNYRVKSATYKIAERKVAVHLSLLDSSSYRVFNNIVLPSQKGSPYTEIDHVVFSPKGIWCVETKSHHGMIYGYSRSSAWKQYLGSECYDMQNPHMQNYKHTESLRCALGLDNDFPIHSIVVFPNSAKVTVDKKTVDYGMRMMVESILSQNSQILNANQCETMLRILNKYNDNKINNLALHLYNLSAV